MSGKTNSSGIRAKPKPISPANAHSPSTVPPTHPAVSLPQQYGGIHKPGWPDRLPASWLPYIQLARLSPPAGLILIYLPHCFGALHAAATTSRVSAPILPPTTLLVTLILLLAAALFCNNAGSAWNDLVDAPLDARVARTRNRPIPRGAISPRAAVLFILSQVALAAGCFLILLRVRHRDMDPKQLDGNWGVRVALPTVLGTAYYPFAKRHTHFAQVVLGSCFAWAAVVSGWAAGAERPWMDASMVQLALATLLWVVIFDTVYAHQDVKDDVKVGVKSMAVLMGEYSKAGLWVMWALMGVLLARSGRSGGMGAGYYVAGVGGCVVSVACIIVKVDLRDPASCWRWFSNGFQFTGVAICGGLLLEYGRQFV